MILRCRNCFLYIPVRFIGFTTRYYFSLLNQPRISCLSSKYQDHASNTCFWKHSLLHSILFCFMVFFFITWCRGCGRNHMRNWRKVLKRRKTRSGQGPQKRRFPCVWSIPLSCNTNKKRRLPYSSHSISHWRISHFRGGLGAEAKFNGGFFMSERPEEVKAMIRVVSENGQCHQKVH